MKGKPKKGIGSGGASKSSLNAGTSRTSTIKDFSKETEKKNKIVEDNDEELNSGFGEYLRSPEAVEMMKLFVVANTVVLILTKAWPSVKEIFKIFEEWWFYKNLQ